MGKRIVEVNGGEITIETEVSEGTKVTLSIPINPRITDFVEIRIPEKEIFFVR